MTKKRRSKKNPYIGFELADLMRAEADSYTIQVGEDLFSNKGKLTFNKRSTMIFYNKILNNLMYLASHGNVKERKYAIKCLSNLYVSPLRVH